MSRDNKDFCACSNRCLRLLERNSCWLGIYRGVILPLMKRIAKSHTDSVLLTKQTYGMHVESFFPCRSS